MPKRQKEAKLLPGEGRPTESLNLGDFLFAKVSQKKATSQQKSSTSLESDFPDLCLSSASEVKVNSNSRTPLSSDSAALAPTSTSTPQSSELSAPTELPYSISKTKKGSLPIRLESRNKGKKVTVIFNVSGDAKELLKELKHAAGCGGVIRDDTVELQGERVDMVEKFLKNKMKKKI